MTWLLWHGELPSRRERDSFRATLAAHRTLPEPTLALLRLCAERGVAPMDALEMATATLSLMSNDAVGIVARMPTIVAAYWHLRQAARPLPLAPILGTPRTSSSC